MSFDQRIVDLKLVLPMAPKPAGTYVPALQIGTLLFVSGHGPLKPDKTLCVGRVGEDLDVQGGYHAAEVVALTMLATLRAHLGTLDRVARLLKTVGMVNAAPTFTDHPKVVDGFSDMMVKVFGEQGRGTRSAVGMSSLPHHIAVEVEAIFEVTS